MQNNKIVLFDGDCNFCNRSVQFIYERDKNGVFRFASLQSPKGIELLSQFGLTNIGLSTLVLIDGEKAYTKSTGALRICGYLKSGWPMMKVFLLVPTFIRNWVYDGVAKRRKSIFKDKCAVPTGEFKARFID